MIYLAVIWQIIVANIKCLLLKIIMPKRIRYKHILRFGKSVIVSIRNKAKVTIGNKVFVGAYSDIASRDGGVLEIGDSVHIGKRNIITCHESIVISKGTILAPDVKIYDHDHMITNGKVEPKKYVTSPVYIGEDCWIGANVVILRGTKIGNNCVVGAGCVLKGEYPDNAVIVQKKDTCVKVRS